MSLHDIWRGDVMPLSGVEVAIGRNSFDPPAPVVPLYDIHNRTLVLHDSAGDPVGPISPGFSGILYYNSLDPEFGGRLEVIPSNSGAQPIVTAVYFDAYQNAGGKVVTSTASTLLLSDVRANSHPDIFVPLPTLASGVQINQSGVYSFEARVSLDATSATVRSSSFCFLEKQPAGGAFAIVPGSRMWGYHRLTANGEDTMNMKVILDVNLGDTFRLRGQVLGTSPNVTQLLLGTSLTIRKLR